MEANIPADVAKSIEEDVQKLILSLTPYEVSAALNFLHSPYVFKILDEKLWKLNFLCDQNLRIRSFNANCEFCQWF